MSSYTNKELEDKIKEIKQKYKENPHHQGVEKVKWYHAVGGLLLLGWLIGNVPGIGNNKEYCGISRNTK